MEAMDMKDRTELVFIIDRSGSMSGLESDTIGGFNRVLEENRKLPGECLVTTVLFDSTSSTLHDRLPVQQVPKLTAEDYRPGGMTALLDALGGAMDRLVWEKDAPAHAQFVIITDGMENSSRRYTAQRVKQMVIRLQQERGWDFIFLGANIDAIGAAADIGIREDRAVNAINDEEGMGAQYEAVLSANLEFRSAPKACRSAAWKKAVEKDAARRGKA